MFIVFVVIIIVFVRFHSWIRRWWMGTSPSISAIFTIWRFQILSSHKTFSLKMNNFRIIIHLFTKKYLSKPFTIRGNPAEKMTCRLRIDQQQERIKLLHSMTLVQKHKLWKQLYNLHAFLMRFFTALDIMGRITNNSNRLEYVI